MSQSSASGMIAAALSALSELKESALRNVEVVKTPLKVPEAHIDRTDYPEEYNYPQTWPTKILSPLAIILQARRIEIKSISHQGLSGRKSAEEALQAMKKAFRATEQDVNQAVIFRCLKKKADIILHALDLCLIGVRRHGFCTRFKTIIAKLMRILDRCGVKASAFELLRCIPLVEEDNTKLTKDTSAFSSRLGEAAKALITSRLSKSHQDARRAFLDAQLRSFSKPVLLKRIKGEVERAASVSGARRMYKKTIMHAPDRGELADRSWKQTIYNRALWQFRDDIAKVVMNNVDQFLSGCGMKSRKRETVSEVKEFKKWARLVILHIVDAISVAYGTTYWLDDTDNEDGFEVRYVEDSGSDGDNDDAAEDRDEFDDSEGEEESEAEDDGQDRKRQKTTNSAETDCT